MKALLLDLQAIDICCGTQPAILDGVLHLAPHCPSWLKAPAFKNKFIIAYETSANDGVFLIAYFENFLHNHIDVKCKADQLSNNIKITCDGESS